MFYSHSFICGCPVFHVPFIEEIFSPIICFCLLCHRLIDHKYRAFIYRIYFWVLYSLLISCSDSHVYFLFKVLNHFGTVALVYSLKLGTWYLQLCSSFSPDCFDNSEVCYIVCLFVLWLHVNFSIIFQVFYLFCENIIDIFIGIA